MSNSPRDLQQSQDQITSVSSSMASATIHPPRPVSGGRRPKLSLQTAIQPPLAAQKISVSAGPGPVVDSPTSRNTHANASRIGFSQIRSSPTSPRFGRPAVASPRNLSPLHSAPASPKGTRDTPYAIPRGSRPILRNSPLKGRLPSARSPRSSRSPRSQRSPRRIFVPSKRVLFRDTLVELMPTPLIDASESESDLEPNSSCASAAGDMGEHGETRMPHVPTPIARRKKHRDWVWTIGADSPGEGKFLRGKDDKPIYPRTPGPNEDDSGSCTDDDKTPSRIPLPGTPATPASAAKTANPPSQVPLLKTPSTPAVLAATTPSQIPLPDTPVAQAAPKSRTTYL